jgi:hypothetical protein
MELPTDGFRVFVEPRWWRFDKRVLQARRLGDRVLIIFDYMAYAQGKPAANLVAYDLHQKELWVGENPDQSATAAYVNFISDDPLKAWNFACYVCTLDPQNGKILQSQFTK